jgi:hypothetical protein
LRDGLPVSVTPAHWGRRKLQALIQMASGGGKTCTACNFIYRLIKHAGAKRILFLEDRSNLGRRALAEFQKFRTPEESRLFTELHNVQRMQSNKLDDVSARFASLPSSAFTPCCRGKRSIRRHSLLVPADPLPLAPVYWFVTTEDGLFFSYLLSHQPFVSPGAPLCRASVDPASRDVHLPTTQPTPEYPDSYGNCLAESLFTRDTRTEAVSPSLRRLDFSTPT